MTREQKLKKAVAIAVAYYVEQEKAEFLADRNNKSKTGWNQAGKTIQMNVQRMMQQRTSIGRPRTLFKSEEPYMTN